MPFQFINSNNKNWKRLDNAGKIFPYISNKRDTKVFRFVCELNEPINQEFLQTALERNLEQFPLYRSVLKSGFFWHYLKQSNIKPIVREEYEYPCSQKYDANKISLLFEVTYFKNRINVEVYHALSDGTGALHFLRGLVYHYIMLAHSNDFTIAPHMIYDASLSQRAEDSFQKYYTKPTKIKSIPKKVYQIKGTKLPEGRIRVLEGVINVKDILTLSKQYQTTITVLICAILLCAVHKETPMKQRNRPVVVTVPVNLRNYFESQSARNFFCTVEVGYDFSKNSNELKEVIKYVSESFKKQLTPENLTNIMNSYIKVEKNVFARATPLFLKNIVLNIAGKKNSKKHTVSVSNIGKVGMPEEMHCYIKLFDVFVSTEKTQICMCSFKDNLVITFTSAFDSPDIEKNFFRTLTSMGLDVQISCNNIQPIKRRSD